jgi:hypothetical protein
MAGKDVSDIVIEAFTTKGRAKEVMLTDQIWQTSLLRGPWKNEFQQLWQASKHAAAKKIEALDSLKQIPGFENMAKLFIRDLKCFSRDEEARFRLEETKHEYYLGGIYFAATTVDKILDMPLVGKSTVKQELDKLSRRIMEGEQQNEMCAPHNLAPIFVAAFGLDWEKLRKDMALQVIREITSIKGGKKKPFGAKFGGTVRRGIKKAKSLMFRQKSSDDQRWLPLQSSIITATRI